MGMSEALLCAAAPSWTFKSFFIVYLMDVSGNQVQPSCSLSTVYLKLKAQCGTFFLGNYGHEMEWKKKFVDVLND